MIGNQLPDSDHVARYCRPRDMDPGGWPLPEAFLVREGEDYLSVNWLEYFQEPDLSTAVQHVRETFRTKGFRLGRRGAFAIIVVSDAKKAIREQSGNLLRFEYAPSRDDASHAAIYGYAARDYVVAAELAALVGPPDVYPAMS